MDAPRVSRMSRTFETRGDIEDQAASDLRVAPSMTS